MPGAGCAVVMPLFSGTLREGLCMPARAGRGDRAAAERRASLPFRGADWGVRAVPWAASSRSLLSWAEREENRQGVLRGHLVQVSTTQTRKQDKWRCDQ